MQLVVSGMNQTYRKREDDGERDQGIDSKT